VVVTPTKRPASTGKRAALSSKFLQWRSGTPAHALAGSSQHPRRNGTLDDPGRPGKRGCGGGVLAEKREHPNIMFAIGWHLGRATGWIERRPRGRA
jgi:hypothetical protein